jgi:hypothetical protein
MQQQQQTERTTCMRIRVYIVEALRPEPPLWVNMLRRAIVLLLPEYILGLRHLDLECLPSRLWANAAIHGFDLCFFLDCFCWGKLWDVSGKDLG